MTDKIRFAYTLSTLPSIRIGSVSYGDKSMSDAPVCLVLKTLNRHGLIAGATGSGKTKTIQVMAEQLSAEGIPSLLMDIKGDLSGLGMPGVVNDFLTNRAASLGVNFTPRSFPVEYFTLHEGSTGIPVRVQLDNFGALLLSKLLGFNDTQADILTLVFRFAKDHNYPLIDLTDLKLLLQYVQSDEGEVVFEKEYGNTARSSLGAMLRSILALLNESSVSIFGTPALPVNAYMRTNQKGEGIISILRLMDVQESPKVFSTMMLNILTELYQTLPEVGDLDKPKLMLFIDEAHLLFDLASSALLDSLLQTVKLIRSKGVGIIFCTQTPNDIPEAVLGQLGLKIQHALRAFTAKDRKAIKLMAENFPPSDDYDVKNLLTSLSIGEALVTALDGKGEPLPLIECVIRAPESRMGTLTDIELSNWAQTSTLLPQYKQRSQYPRAVFPTAQQPISSIKSNGSSKKAAQTPDIITTLSKNTLFRQVVRQIFRQITQLILAMIGGRKR